jgi:hypothetical protein
MAKEKSKFIFGSIIHYFFFLFHIPTFQLQPFGHGVHKPTKVIALSAS